MVLAGETPDYPPHWELDFQLGPEMFGLAEPDWDSFDSESARKDAAYRYRLELTSHLINECGWAAALPLNPFDADDLAPTKRAFGEYALVPGFDGGGVFWMPRGEDMVDFAVRLFEDPWGLHEQARKKCENSKAKLRTMADTGADFFVLTYDFGYNNGPFVSPTHFREFCAPYLAEMAQAAHDLGKKAILHSDGCLNEILDQIHATGVDGYHSIDPQGHMDIRQVRETYPDWILMGNVACSMLQDADEPRIRDSVRYCLRHGGVGKRYIFSTSNCVFKGMPVESYRVMLDEYRRTPRQ